MNSELFTLPQDFCIGSSDTMIYFYSNRQSSVKNKVVFTKNMFCLLLHGLKEVQTATGKEVITNNELLMLTSGSTLMSESLAENNRYEAILIFFGNTTLLEFCTKRSLVTEKNLSAKSVLKVDRDGFLNNYCHSLQLLREENNTEINELKVQEILGYVHSKYPVIFSQLVSRAFTGNTDIKLRQVVELNRNKELTIDEFAFLCNMSVSTFKRHFLEIYKMPPRKYFSQLKMEQAKSLLSLQKRPSEIYADLGYENLSAFSNEFKKYFGFSPRQFQNKMSCQEKFLTF